MANFRDIRRRIRTVHNTAQITRAMEMVAAAKMRKAQQAALAGRPYATLLAEVLAQASTHAGDYLHTLMEPRPLRTRVVIVVSTDKGLCGSLNTNLLREAMQFDPANTLFIAAGRKGASFLARARRRLVAEFRYRDAPLLSEARTISRFASGLFLDGDVDHVDVLFSEFVSTLVQRVSLVHLLPVGCPHGAAAAGPATTDPCHRLLRQEVSSPDLALGVDFTFEPNTPEIMQNLLIRALDFRVYQILLEARASEHSARMVAMKSATDNAHNLVDELTLEYNKLRQAAITSELLEISSAIAAATGAT